MDDWKNKPKITEQTKKDYNNYCKKVHLVFGHLLYLYIIKKHL